MRKLTALCVATLMCSPVSAQSYFSQLLIFGDSLLDSGNLKVEGCLLRLCGHEEWKPMEVAFNEDGSRSAKIKE